MNVAEQDVYIKAEVYVKGCDTYISEVTKIPVYSVTDLDGNLYRTVKIGNQECLAENLKTTTYNDSTPIYGFTKWTINHWDEIHLEYAGYCWYEDNSGYGYGALYNEHTINKKTLFPLGWHVPSDDEWKQLEIFIGMSEEEVNEIGWRGTNHGDILKESETDHWNSDNEGTNDFSFSAVGGGYNTTNNSYAYLREKGYYRTSTNGYIRLFIHDSSKIYRGTASSNIPYSVRCVNNFSLKPYDPIPACNNQVEYTEVELMWIGHDFGEKVFYDIYFDTMNATTLFSANHEESRFIPLNLLPNIRYYWKVKVKNNNGKEITSDVWNFTTYEDTNTTGTVIDVDGNIYKTVKIGDKWWMAVNIKTTHYADSSEVIYIYHDNDSTSVYGAFYTWNAMMNGASPNNNNPSRIQGICPDNWHLPSTSEWEELFNYVKSDGYSSNPGATLRLDAINAYGFSSISGYYALDIKLFFPSDSYWTTSVHNNIDWGYVPDWVAIEHTNV